MRRRIWSRPSPAAVIGSLAILVTLAGTGMTVVSEALPRGSVGTAQLKANAVTSAKVRNGSLLRADVGAGQIPLGPAGPTGAAGPQGAKGDKGAKGDRGPLATLVLRGAARLMPGGGVGENGNYDSERFSVSCNAGEKAISGGTYWLPVTDDLELWTGELRPISSAENAVVGFTTRAGNDSGSAHTFQVYVLCYAG